MVLVALCPPSVPRLFLCSHGSMERQRLLATLARDEFTTLKSETEHDGLVDDADEADDDELSMPVCMPNPTSVMILLEEFLGDGRPVRRVTCYLCKVILTLHGLMAAVMVAAALGGMRLSPTILTSPRKLIMPTLNLAALLKLPSLTLPEELDRLITVAANEAGLHRDVAAICMPAIAGLGEALAVGAMWSGWRLADRMATALLALMFAIVAYVHWRAGTAILPPLAFVAIATLKFLTTTPPHAKSE